MKKNISDHVQLVLKQLRKYKLFAKLNKCDFDLKKVDYLKFIVEINNIHKCDFDLKKSII
jgi:hypothetical protein